MAEIPIFRKREGSFVFWLQKRIYGGMRAKVVPAGSDGGAQKRKETMACCERVPEAIESLEKVTPLFDDAIEAYRRHCARCRAMSSSNKECVVYSSMKHATQGQQALDTLVVMDFAKRLVDSVRNEVAIDLEQRKGYLQMAKFLLTTALMLIVVVGQHGWSTEKIDMYHAIKGQMFGETTAVTSGGVEVIDHVTESTAWLTFLEENILDHVFEEETCGDGICNRPDEMPYYHAGTNARSFPSCETDCGRAATKKYRISFTDPWKLWYATKHMEAARENGWNGRSAQQWKSAERYPAAGFNLCAKNRREYGAFEDVCIFDGDLEIDGQRYRSDELLANSSTFGAPVQVELFQGDWELRIAYTNFEWPTLDTAPEEVPPKAFPAVGGTICEQVLGSEDDDEEEDDDEDDATIWGNCQFWAPCPDSDTCTCNFFKGEHLCYNEEEWRGDAWHRIYYEYGWSLSNEWLGKWWDINATVNVTSLDDVEEVNEANAEIGDDDVWNSLFKDACGEDYYLHVYDTFQDGGWSGASLKLIDESTDDAIIEDVRAGSSNYDLFEVSLCRQTTTYKVYVTPNCVEPYSTSSVYWELHRGATGTVVSSGSDCVSACDPLTTNPCPSDCSAFESCSIGLRRLDVETSAPTSFPANVFGVDLSAASSNNEKFFLSSRCSYGSVGDSVCDALNNNAACGWDGGDCCTSTCDGDSCEDLVPSDCRSPVELGSSDEDGHPCVVSYDDDDDEDDISGSCTPNWPFSVTLSQSNWQMKMPFTAYVAFKQIMSVKNGFSFTDEEMPSIFCGDCEMSEQAFSFTVTVANESSSLPMFPKIENLERTRYFVHPNLVLIGPMVTTTRYRTEKCKASDRVINWYALPRQRIDGKVKKASHLCVTDQKSTKSLWSESERRRFKSARYDRDPYGTDATFMSSSSAYRATNEISDFYDESVNEFGLPHGFFYKQGARSAEKVGGFPVVFDVNFNSSRYKQVVELMRSGGYIDIKTRRVQFRMALVNSETGLVALVQDTANRVDGGGFVNEWTISIVDTLLYEDSQDYLRLSIEILYAVALVCAIAAEVRDISLSWRTYVSDWKNWIDVASFATQLALVSAWISHAFLCSSLSLQTHSYVYSDFFAVGRILDAGPGLDETFRMYDNLSEIVGSASQYQTLVAATVILSVLQFLKTLHFHQKMGLTTSTLIEAGRDLAFFSFLFLFILVVYAVLGVLLFGEELAGFQSFGYAVMSLVDILFGEYGSTADAKNDGNGLVIVFFYSFVAVSSLILLNALLAIIVDSYGVVKERSNRRRSREVLPTMLRELAGRTHPPKANYLSADVLLRALTALRDDDSLILSLRTAPAAASNKVLLTTICEDDDEEDSVVALTQPMLKELLSLLGTTAGGEIVDCICYNLVEQWGVLPRVDDLSIAERLSLERHRELLHHLRRLGIEDILVVVSLLLYAVPLLLKRPHACLCQESS